MGLRGPPFKEIDWEQFDKLVSLQCTQEEIAAWFEVCVDTLDAACQRERGEKLSDVWDKRKLIGRIRLRKAQFAIAEGRGPGAATMAIYLDKKMMPNENPDRQPPGPTPPASAANALAQPRAPLTFIQFCIQAGYYEPFEKQIEMMRFIVDADEPSLLLGARGYGKTDYGTIMGLAYDLYLDWFDGTPTQTNIIVTKTKVRNTAIIEEIAGALKKNGVPLEKENSSCIRIQGLQGKDHSVEALPIRSSFRGRHPYRLLMDDPVTEEDVSEAMHALVKRKYSEAMKLTKRVILIGQPAHAFDLYSEVRGAIRKMEVPHGQIPQLDADLVALRIAGVDQSSIDMSYHLRLPKGGGTVFGNLKRIDAMPEGDTVAFVDPSDGGDYTALSVVRGFGQGVAVFGRLWHMAWYDAADEIIAELVKRRVKVLYFETNATGNQPIMQLRQALAPHGIGVIGVFSITNKVAVIRSAGNVAHMIHLSRESDTAYADQVIRYSHKAKHDDAPDSLARLLETIGFIRGKDK